MTLGMKQVDLPHQSVDPTHQQTMNVVGFRGSILGRIAWFDKAMVVLAGDGSGSGNSHEECPVMKEWIKLEALVSRAADGKIALMHAKNIDRTTVANNYELLLPLVANYGTLIYLNSYVTKI